MVFNLSRLKTKRFSEMCHTTRNETLYLHLRLSKITFTFEYFYGVLYISDSECTCTYRNTLYSIRKVVQSHRTSKRSSWLFPAQLFHCESTSVISRARQTNKVTGKSPRKIVKEPKKVAIIEPPCRRNCF